MRDGVLRWLLVIGVTAVATTAAVFTPRLLRRMDAYHIQQVEVTGARYLSPQEAVAATGIAPTSTVFDDFAPWRESLLRHPLVLDVRVARRLPYTLVLDVTETRPVAFVLLPELRPVDERGRLLDIDPARVPLDLPLLAAEPGRVGNGALTDRALLRSLASLGRIAELEPALFALVSEAAPLRDGVRLTLREPAGAEVLLPDSPDAARLHLLRLTLADVDNQPMDTAATRAAPRVRRADARYREQIVVALTPNESR